MVKVKLHWTKTAILQRHSIFNYWNKRTHSLSYSQKLKLKIKEKTELLKSNPSMGKEIGFEKIRCLPMNNFSIFYILKQDEIFILSFWDNRQDPKSLFMALGNRSK